MITDCVSVCDLATGLGVIRGAGRTRENMEGFSTEAGTVHNHLRPGAGLPDLPGHAPSGWRNQVPGIASTC